MSYKDGDFTTASQNGPRVPSYPFADGTPPDLYPVKYERDMMVLSANLALSTTARTSIAQLLTYSEDDDNAAWTKADATVSANSVANPNDGQQTANTLLETATTAEHTIAMAKAIAASPVTFYRCLKANGRDWARLKITDSAASSWGAFFNLSTGVVGTVSVGATSGIITIPGATGWYLCWITVASPASGSATFLAQPSTDGSTVSYAGDITKGLYLYAAQAEQSSTWHAYIKTEGSARTGSAPNLEYNEAQAGSDPFAFLVYEDREPSMELIVAHFTRRHARIPGPQVSYPGSRYFPLPNVTNDFDGLFSLNAYNYPLNALIGAGYYNQAASAIFTDNGQALYGTVKTLGVKTIGVASGGTFTLTYGADTTASLNWNDTGATIAAAINGLTSISAAGITVTVSNTLNAAAGGTLVITITVGGTFTPITMTSSLTLSASNHPTTQIVNSASQVIRMADNYVCTSHGLSTGLTLAVVRSNDSMLIITTGNWGSVDSNTLWLPTTQGVGDYAYVATYARVYPAGQTFLLRTKETTNFYLPGVTLGITTGADISSPVGLQNAPDFVNALLTLTGFQAYQSEGPQPWEDSMILTVRTVAINLDDVA